MSVLASGGKIVRLNGKAIEAPQGGDLEPQVKNVTITANGTSSVTPDDGKVLSTVNVTVNVPSDAKEEEEKTVDITENGETVVEPSAGKALSKVTANVNVPQGVPIVIDTPEEMDSLAVAANINKIYAYIGDSTDKYENGHLYCVLKSFGAENYALIEFEQAKILGEKTITANGTYVPNRLVDNVDGWNKVIVNVGSSDGIPIEVSSAAMMDALLAEENVGRMYHYTGPTTESYIQGYYYLVGASIMDGTVTEYFFYILTNPISTGETTITANGTYKPNGLIKAWTKVTVNVPSSGGGSLPADLYSTIKANGTAFDPQNVQFTLTAPSGASRLYIGVKAENGKTYCTTVEKLGGASSVVGYNTDLSLFALEWDSEEAVNMTNGPIAIQYIDTTTGEQITVEGTEGYYLFV